ncbi:hypothetical protein M407DRAFT_30069 [Tulasnella calospora MUT 4182]|uniref:Altered inheritance of mitochondria protein 24, mitochondrial n=1 Tax=Tulasnella calospora MUT 4182 TaxID=1051891 RepID=A0A0C3LFN7_9AGAM|nr:hypothetical protein M407DRAFT_30069 [Tulasnella calospora MUT 4182]
MTNISGNNSGIVYRIDHRNSNTLVVANISSGASLKVNPGAIVAMQGSIQISEGIKFSFRKVFTGDDLVESIFSGFGEVLLAPDFWGDVIPINIDGQTIWRIDQNAFLACTSEVMRRNESQGRGLFSGDELPFTEVTGHGILFVQSLGAIIKRELQQGEEWLVVNGHLVAWTVTF